ncbi:MAG: EAL domain-containing protein [Butyrivibrio sp.]|nr:EAL domain-containing protein [Muribaculum sp.]MCM1553103.1 EAL domain-containing protein [Butyrivibrio sp.]
MIRLNYFNYCALGIGVVLLFIVLARNMLNGRRNRYFWYLLLVLFCSTVFDILAVELDNGTELEIMEKYITHGGYLILHSLSVPVYLLYLSCLTDSMYKLKNRLLLQLGLAAPFVIVLLMVLTSFTYHSVFYIDANGSYIMGPWYGVLYAAALFYICLGVFYALRYRKQFEKGQLLSLLCILPVMLAALWVQVNYPLLRIEMFTHALCVLFLLLMVQKPEERTDPVTGFGKTTAYAMDIDQAIANKKPICIILINILNYKSLRDILGYGSMNQLIRIVSSKLKRLCRSALPKADPYYIDWGRFCLVTGRENFGRIDSAAEALSEMLREDIILQGLDISLQANLCVIRCPEDMSDFQGIFAFSNEFEEYGKTGKVLYAEEILKDGRYIIKDINDIVENAVNKQRLEVYYQPIYAVEEKRFVSAEALIRLDDEEYGHISPELFIPIAEKNGVINQIGAYVLEEVCRFIASDEFKELEMEYIEVNLSVTQCMRNNLADEILGMLEKYKIRPEQINLEITETAVVDSQSIMSENISKLAAAGIPFSLDDFGTGYSNMSRMTSMPLSIVKLDKSFTDLKDNPKLEAVVRNTVKMVKDMHMKIVVEGIETEEIARLFSDLRCDYIQGFYYSRPLTRDDFVQFLRGAKAAEAQ